MKGKTRKVKKMKMGGKAILGTLSPVYGMATGEGAFGESVGVLPALAKRARERRGSREEEVVQNPRNVPVDESGMVQAPRAMKKGGKVEKKALGGAIKSFEDATGLKGRDLGKISFGKALSGSKNLRDRFGISEEAASKMLSQAGVNKSGAPINQGGMAPAARAMKKGGKVTKGIDGCAMKGKTRAKRSK